MEAAGRDSIAAKAGIDPSIVDDLLAKVSADVERLPADEDERAFDEALARAAVRIAMKRHAGTVEIVHTVNGPVSVQQGKDLGSVTAVIGTGGALVYGRDDTAILSGCRCSDEEPGSLRPRDPALMVDRAYVLYAAGLLSDVEAEAAFDFAMASLESVERGGQERENELRITS